MTVYLMMAMNKMVKIVKIWKVKYTRIEPYLTIL